MHTLYFPSYLMTWLWGGGGDLTIQRTLLDSISDTYLQHSYTAHTVNFLLCYFIDLGHNYPLF